MRNIGLRGTMVICDIDRTLADCNHREKYLEKNIIDKKKCTNCQYVKGKRTMCCTFKGDCLNAKISQESWDEFFLPERVAKDPVLPYACDVLKVLDRKHILYYYSGRFEKLRETTEQWLIKNGFPFSSRILLRADDDLRSGLITKKEILNTFLDEKRVIVIDDDERFKTWCLAHKMYFFLAKNDFWKETYTTMELFK